MCWVQPVDSLTPQTRGVCSQQTHRRLVKLCDEAGGQTDPTGWRSNLRCCVSTAAAAKCKKIVLYLNNLHSPYPDAFVAII